MIGKALFYADHPYNIAYDRVIQKGFVGISALTIIAEGREHGVFRNVQYLNALKQLRAIWSGTRHGGGGASVASISSDSLSDV